MTQDDLDRTVQREYVAGLERLCRQLGYETSANATVIRALQDTLKREKERADILQTQHDSATTVLDVQGKKIERLEHHVSRLKKKKAKR